MLIRPVRKEDAGQLYRISAESSVSRGINNLAFVDAGGMQELVAGLKELDHFFVLETETPPVELCAALLLSATPMSSKRRNAKMELMVGKKWQSQGLGKALMYAALDLADNELMLERIEVEIDVENTGALKLYKSFGFKVEGTAQDWGVLPSGGYIDAYLMARRRPVKTNAGNKQTRGTTA